MSEWLVFGMIAGILFGLQVILTKYILNIAEPVAVSIFLFGGTTVALLAYALFSGKAAVPEGNALLLLAVTSVILAAGNIFFFKAINLASNPGYVVAAASLNIIVSTAVSIFTFSLKINPAGFAGIALILAGVYMLSAVN